MPFSVFTVVRNRDPHAYFCILSCSESWPLYQFLHLCCSESRQSCFFWFSVVRDRDPNAFFCNFIHFGIATPMPFSVLSVVVRNRDPYAFFVNFFCSESRRPLLFQRFNMLEIATPMPFSAFNLSRIATPMPFCAIYSVRNCNPHEFSGPPCLLRRF